MGDPGMVLRETRRAAGLSQAELARRAGTTQAAIARIETGRTSPTIRTLQKLLGAAGMRLDLSASPAPSSIDETLIARQLRMTPAERLKSFEIAYNDIRKLAGAAARSRGSRA